MADNLQQNSQSKSSMLSDLKLKIIQDNPTPELSESAIQLVLGDGNPDADIMFIGEAPGKNEDEKGIPFVGAAGKFLDKMLESIHLNRSDVYITNIVKYRPPNNRDPLPAEKLAFIPYLEEQIQIINPKLIVTLGRHAGGCLIPDLQIGRDHGKVFKIAKRMYLALYHPAAALYNGGQREMLMFDFAKIPLILNKINQ